MKTKWLKRFIAICLIIVLFLTQNSHVFSKTGDEPFIDYTYYDYIVEVSKDYSMCPELVCAIIWRESRWDIKARKGDCIGLMQISKKWHEKRLESTGGEDLEDPEDNIKTGVDYLAELFEKNEDIYLVLMEYNGTKDFYEEWEDGNYSDYAIEVADISEQFERSNGK